MSIVADKRAGNRTAVTQLLRVIRHEEPLFLFHLGARSLGYWYAKYIQHKTVLTKRIHGSLMALDLNDPGISRSLLLVGDREKEHRYMLERVVKPGDTVLDIGANVGYYALLERRLMRGKGLVVAIEPSPTNYQQLCANIQLNGADKQIVPINAAAAERDGEGELHLSRLSNVHSLIASQVPRPLGKSVRIPTLSLATLAKRFGPIALLRMDIEGYEYAVLRSLVALNQTQRFLPSILFELHPPKYRQADFSELLTELYALGYHAKYLACSHDDMLRQAQINIIHRVKTDGTIRYIARDVPLPALQKVIFHSRAVLLQASS